MLWSWSWCRLLGRCRMFIRSAIRKLGLDIVRYAPEVSSPFPVLPLVIRELLSTSRPFFFVQIGACDGEIDDPLNVLIRQHRLAGLLVEPLPDIFMRLREHYGDQPQLLFENV